MCNNNILFFFIVFRFCFVGCLRRMLDLLLKRFNAISLTDTTRELEKVPIWILTTLNLRCSILPLLQIYQLVATLINYLILVITQNNQQIAPLSRL